MKDTIFEFNYHGVAIAFRFPERSDYIKDKIISNANFYEEDLLAEISRLPIAEGAFCDVGANIGNHSVFFSRVLGRDVYAFEPVLESYGLLFENLELNGVASKVQAFNVALGASESCGVMQVHESNLGASRLVAEEGGGVKISLLDSILPPDSNIALIKIDVEGYECEVLRGAANTIRRCRPVLVIESQSIVSFVEIGSVVQDYGYIPIGQKGNTATVFYVHEDSMPLYRDIIPFLSRNDVDGVRRRVQGQLEGVKSKILSSIKVVAEKLEYDGSDLAADIQQLKGASAGVQQVLEGVAATFNEHLRDAGRVREVESRCYELESELEGKVLLLEELSRSSEQKIAAYEQTISALKMNNSELEGQVLLHEEFTRSSEQEIAACEQIISSLKMSNSELDGQVLLLEEFSRSSEQEMAVCEEIISSLKSNNSKLEGQVLLLEESRRSSEQKIAACEQTISTLKVNNQALASQVKLEQIKSEHLYSALERSFNSKLHKLQSNMFSVSNRATFGLVSARKSWDVFSGQLDRQIRAAQERQGVALTCVVEGPSALQQRQPELTHAISRKATAVGTQKVRVGIASIEVRRTALSHVIDCLYDQVDELYIYLNDYSFVPDFLNREKITVIHDKGDVGDRGKFYGLMGFEGYYFTCDDDISYPSYYVKHCIDGIERYGRRSVVGWHGSLILHPFVDYYTPTSRRVLSFRAGRPKDTAVHVLGTGCTAFHTSTIQLKYEDFKTSNMADIYFALIGQAQNIPFVVLKHDAGEALPLDIPDDKAIHKESMASTGSKADTKALQNKLVAEHKSWNAPVADLVVARESKTVAYVGRVDAERWKKGGILKSGKMIINALRRFGHRVIPIELDTEYGSQVSSIKDADIVWIYPGDPNRPDFRLVEQLIEHAAGSGKTVFVNLSFNAMPARTEWIVEKLSAWKLAYGSRVKACVFTNTLKGISSFSSIEDNLVCLPKTIDFDVDCAPPTFSATKGIFFGDLQKLLNRDLVGGDISVWLDALRKALPGVPLYAVRQYGGKIDRDLGLEVIPYTVGRAWDDFISSCRIVTCLTPHATFEMIPVESAGLGIPAIYRPMLHAHTEVLSVSGIEVKTVEEFVHACKCLYNDEAIWNSYSISSRLRAQSLHIDHISASIHQQMVMASR
ncbi:Chromosome partition protein Smc [compost metagenome]